MLEIKLAGPVRLRRLLSLSALALVGAAGFGTSSAVAAAPVCTDVSYTVQSGIDLVAPINGPCTDTDGPNPLQGQIVTFPSHGSIGPGANGGGIYRSTSGYTGPDSFTFRAFDGAETSNTATVTIDVTPGGGPGNLPPTCPESHAYVPEGGSVVLIANCVDPEDDPITYGLASPSVQLGTIDGFTPVSVVYHPFATTLAGAVDTLGYSADDPFHSPVTFAVTITVTEAGETEFETAPEATDDEPFAALIDAPVAGPVYIDTRAVTEVPPTGFFFLDQEFDITAPDAVDPSDPLRFVFKLDASEVAALGIPIDEIEVFRDGDPVEDCDDFGSGTADPTPCIDARDPQGDGDLWITALTMEASIWNFGASDAPPDGDGDGVVDAEDNCPADPNPAQTDQDEDGIGAACDSKEVPTSKDDCKKNGWRAFNGKYTFRNQGDCVSFVATGGGNPPAG